MTNISWLRNDEDRIVCLKCGEVFRRDEAERDTIPETYYLGDMEIIGKLDVIRCPKCGSLDLDEYEEESDETDTSKESSH